MAHKDILVSICTVTYNHEEFIAQAIESVLAQKCDYQIEMIIGDDCSTDETAAIIKSYQKKHPEIIKPIFRNKNIGAQNNSFQCLNACTGKYIAALEGDDYWIDPMKLQKQVDFLESHPDYSVIFHRVYEQVADKTLVSTIDDSDVEMSYAIEDLAKGNFIHTPSVVFRNGLISKYPLWFTESPIGDYVLHLLNAKKGRIKYLPDLMAVYRRHSGGVFSGISLEKFYPNWITLLTNLIAEPFPENIIGILIAQRNSTVKNYFLWLLEYNNYDLLKRRLFEFGNIVDISLMTDISIDHIKSVKESRTYKFASRLAELKKRLYK